MLSFSQLIMEELCLQTVRRLRQLMHKGGVQREPNLNICSLKLSCLIIDFEDEVCFCF